MTIEERIKEIEGRIAYAYEGESETVRLQDETFLLSELKRCREALKEASEHSCSEEGDEFGIRPCCNVADYKPHKPTCYIQQALHPEGVK